MNIEAEKGVISALINIEDFGHTLPFKIKEDDFTNSSTRLIGRITLGLIDAGQKPTKNLIISTAKSLAVDDFEEQTRGYEDINEIINLHPTKEEALSYVRQLKKESIKSSAKKHLKNLYEYIQTTEDPLKDILAKAENTILSLTSSADFNEEEAVNLADTIEEALEFYGSHPGNLGLDIGFPEWQNRVGGLGNGLVHMIIATNKTGKSNIGMNAALETAKHMPVLYIDTEMDKTLVATRIFSILTKVPTRILKDGYWNDPTHDDHIHYDRIQQGIQEYKKLKITYIRAAGRQVADLIPTMRKWAIQNKVVTNGKFPQGLIIYDYVKLADFGDLQKYKLQEYQLLGLSMSALKDFCNKYSVPCLTFGQTNREDDSNIGCLGASKRLADLVDSVSLFKAKDEEFLAKDPKGSHIIRIFVARHGPGTSENEHIQFQYDKDIGLIGELGIFKYDNKNEQKRKRQKKSNEPTIDEILEDQFGSND